MSAPLDRLAALVAAMTARPWADDAEVGFISYNHQIVAQTWDKHEEDYSNAAANSAGVAALRNVAEELVAVARAAEKFRECQLEGVVTRHEVDAQIEAVEALFRASDALNAKLLSEIKS